MAEHHRGPHTFERTLKRFGMMIGIGFLVLAVGVPFAAGLADGLGGPDIDGDERVVSE